MYSCVQPHRSIGPVAEPVSFVASSTLVQCMRRRLLGRQLLAGCWSWSSPPAAHHSSSRVQTVTLRISATEIGSCLFCSTVIIGIGRMSVLDARDGGPPVPANNCLLCIHPLLQSVLKKKLPRPRSAVLPQRPRAPPCLRSVG